MAWWNKAVIYQIYPRSFNDTTGNGIGDIKGISQKLNYLKELGVGGIWLSPINQSPMIDNGYDISDYLKVDRLFGTNKEFYELIKKARHLDINILFDFVMNHTSNKHIWFQKAIAGNKKYMDYYIFKKESGEEKSAFGGSAWTYVKKLKKYYFHSHAIEQPDLDWTNHEVRLEFRKIIDFWVEKGIRGFRFDVFDLIGKFYNKNTHKMDFDINLTHKYIQELRLNTEMINNEIMTIGECIKSSLDDAIKFSTPANKELSMVFLFDNQRVDKPIKKMSPPLHFSLKKLKKVIFNQQNKFEENGWNSIFWNNHDSPRIVTRWGNDSEFRDISAKTIGMVGLLLKGTTFIYQGEELGMTNGDFKKISDFRDIDTLNKFKENVQINKIIDEKTFVGNAIKISRDDARTPMQWNHEMNSGFSSGIPWIKTNENYIDINAEEQMSNKNSVFTFYKKLIALKNHKTYSDVITFGKTEELNEYKDNKQIIAFSRSLLDKKIYVMANWSNKPFNLVSKLRFEKSLLSNINWKKSEENTIVSLKPWESIIYVNNMGSMHD